MLCKYHFEDVIQKVFQSPIAKQYFIGAFLINMCCCCYGSQTLIYFGFDEMNGKLSMQGYFDLEVAVCVWPRHEQFHALVAHHVAHHAIDYLLPLLDPPSTAVSIITAATAGSITGTATARSIAAISIVATTAISITATATTAHCSIYHNHCCHNHCCCIATVSTTTNHHHCCHCHIHHHHYCIHCCHHCHYRFLSCCTLR